MQTEIIELTQLAARKHLPFGEFLVQREVLDRFQLLRVLQLQDRLPRVRLGECAVVLGYLARDQMEHLHDRYTQNPGPDLETMATEAFHREPDLEVIYSVY